MTEHERIIKWMEEQRMEYRDLAEKLNVSYSSVYMQVKGGRPITSTFKWNFRKAFGNEHTDAVFGGDNETNCTRTEVASV